MVKYTEKTFSFRLPEEAAKALELVANYKKENVSSYLRDVVANALHAEQKNIPNFEEDIASIKEELLQCQAMISILMNFLVELKTIELARTDPGKMTDEQMQQYQAIKRNKVRPEIKRLIQKAISNYMTEESVWGSFQE